MKRYDVYISEYSYKPEYRPAKKVGVEAVGYQRVVLANSRVEAVKKCLPDIGKELHKLAGKYVSVFVGVRGSVSEAASRLLPIQVVIETGELR